MSTRIRFAWMALCLALTSNGCDDGDSGWSYGVVDDAKVAYIADAENALQISGAWAPSAAIAIDSTRWLYADRGTRQIVEASEGSKRVIWDLSAYEFSLGDEPWEDNWGYNLTSFSENAYLLSAPGRPLIALDRESGSVEVIGQAANASEENRPQAMDGLAIEEVDFSRFRGVSSGAEHLYWVFDDAIYETPRDLPVDDIGAAGGGSGLFAHLKSAKLVRVAGKPGATAEGESGDALETGLSFAKYTHVAEDAGVLYVWETFDHVLVPARLLAIEKSLGKVLVVTGNGVRVPPSSLEDFYAYYLPTTTSLHVRDGKIYSPYWKDASQVLVVDIEAIDWEKLSARGTVDWFASPLESMTGVVPWGKYDLAYDIGAGSFWRLSRSGWEHDAVCIDGAKSKDERLSSLYDEGKASPYAYDALVGTTSVYPWLNGTFAIAYAPTLKRLNLVNMKTKEVDLMRMGTIDALATDDDRRAWYKVGNSMRFLVIEEEGTISESYVSTFFKSPSKTGAPCPADRFKLDSVPELGATGSALLMFESGQNGATIYRDRTQLISSVFEGGWFVPEPSPDADLSSFYNDGLAVSAITSYKVHGSLLLSVQKFGDRQYVVATNMFSAPETFLGHVIEGDKSVIIAGMGNAPISDGAARADVKLDRIVGVDFSIEEDAIWMVQSDGAIYRLGDDNTWTSVDNACVSRFAASVDKVERSCVGKKCVWGVRTKESAWLCDDNGALMYGLPSSNGDLASCGDGTLIHASPHEICTISPAQGKETVCDPFVLDGVEYVWGKAREPNVEDAKRIALSCDGSSVYAAARFTKKDWKDNGEPTSRISVFQGVKDSDGSISWVRSFGDGVGLPDIDTLGNVAFGVDLGQMDFGQNDAFYMWMRDTCTIWRISDSKIIERDSVVERVLTDDALCHAQVVSFGSKGMVYVAYDGKIYRYNAAKGGDELGSDAVWISGTVFDMTEVDDVLMVITSEGLFVVDGDDVNKRLNHPTLVHYDETLPVDYAYRNGAMSRMARVPNENRVWIPTFKDALIMEVTVTPQDF